MSNQSTLSDISFVDASQRKPDLWPVTASAGSYAADNEVGRARADELVAYMRENEAPMVLGHVAAAIAVRGAYGPIEIGFFNQVALSALQGASEGAPIVLPLPADRTPDLRLVQ